MLKKLINFFRDAPPQSLYKPSQQQAATRGRIGGFVDDTVTGNIQARPEPKVTMQAKITRADGTVELVDLDATAIPQR